MADDLRRFLDGRPIVARPVGAAERAWRWARRNPWVAGLGSAAAVLPLATAVLGVTFAVVFDRQKQQAEQLAGEKSQALDQAEANLRTAIDERNQKEQARAAEVVARDKAVKAREVAEEKKKEAAEANRLSSAFNAVAVDTTRGVLLFVDDAMRNRASLAPLRRQVIDLAMKDFVKVKDLAAKSPNPLEGRTEAIAYQRMAEVLMRGNQVAEAGVVYARMAAVLQKLARDNPDEPANTRNLANGTNLQGDVERRLGETEKARGLYAAALKLRNKWVTMLDDQPPAADPGEGKRQLVTRAEARRAVGQSHVLIAQASLLLGEPAAAVEHLRAGEERYAAAESGVTDKRGLRRDRTALHEVFAEAAWAGGDFDEAERRFRAALRDRNELLAESPANRALRLEAARSRAAYADFLLGARKDPAAAAALYRRVFDEFAALLRADPDHLEFRRAVAHAHYRLGVVTRVLAPPVAVAGGPAGSGVAAAHFAECLRLRAELARIDPRDTQAKIEWVLALGRCGKAAEAEKLAGELRAQAGKDRRVLFQAACGLAVAAGGASDPAVAKRCRDEALRVLGDLVANGWKDRFALENDPDLETVRGEKEFAGLLARVPPGPKP